MKRNNYVTAITKRQDDQRYDVDCNRQCCSVWHVLANNIANIGYINAKICQKLHFMHEKLAESKYNL